MPWATRTAMGMCMCARTHTHRFAARRPCSLPETPHASACHRLPSPLSHRFPSPLSLILSPRLSLSRALQVQSSAIRKWELEEAAEWLHGATKKENAIRKLTAGGLKAAVQKGGLGSLVNAAKAAAK